MKMSFLSITGLILSLLAGLAANAADSPQLEQNEQRDKIDAMHGKPAPALALKDWVNSKALTPADLKGKIVVLDFWATWCGPCLASIPHNNELARKYSPQGVIFIGVCSPNGVHQMKETVQKFKIEYPVAADNGGATFEAFMADGYPDYYVINRQGKLLFGDVVNSEIDKAIELALKAEPARK
jgi:cytochrome c biogenesis protein CcmG/thiol:disulfide interchange protein DsbE